MATLQHSVTESWTNGSEVLTKKGDYSSTSDLRISESIPDPSTDLLVACTIDVSQIKAIYIVSDQDITLETNDGTTPADTINLVADKPYVWTDDCYYSNLLATDITALYLTNASGAAAQFDLRVITDSTV